MPTQIKVERVSEERDMMTISVRSRESGSLYAPYLDSEGCFYYASTTTLEFSESPYSLFLELSRGQLSLLMHKLGDWFMLGFQPSEKLHTALRNAVKRFAKLAVMDYDSPAFDSECVKFFDKATELNRRVNETILTQILTARRNQAEPWQTRFGFSARLDEEWSELYDAVFAKRRGGLIRPKYDAFFSGFAPEFSWADIEKEEGVYDWTALDRAYEHAKRRGLELTLGPLMRWGERVPLFVAGRPEEEVAALFKRYLHALFERDAGRTRRWIVATNVETDVAETTIETRLTLAAQTAVAIRKIDPKAQAFLGFEQPFGDGALTEAQVMSPLELASRLMRKNVFDGFYLEVNFGGARNATFPRDPMELHRFFDRWCALGVPLRLGLSCPSAPDPRLYDAAAQQDSTESVSKYANGSSERADDLLAVSPEEAALEAALWNEKNQRETTRRFITAALSRRFVDEIVWTRFTDASAEVDEESTHRSYRVDEEDEPYENYETELTAEIALAADDDATDELEFETAEELDEFKTRRRAGRIDPRARDRFPTSGLFDVNAAPKPTLQKLSATKRAYID